MLCETGQDFGHKFEVELKQIVRPDPDRINVQGFEVRQVK